MNNKFTKYFPKNIIFLGAGATSKLMPMTWHISDFFTTLTKHSNNENDLDSRIDKACKNFSQVHKEAIKSLLLMLGESGEKERFCEIYQKSEIYSQKYCANFEEIKKELTNLQNLYSWQCFKAIAQRSENDKDKLLSIQTLYTQFDLLIEQNAGFNTEKKFFYPHEVVAGRNCITLFTTLLLFSETSKKLAEDADTVKKYEFFFATLADLMRQEAIDKENFDFESREFLLFSYAIVSFNWDPVLLGMMFKAHKDFNHGNKIPYLGKNCRKLRLFNDFGTVIGSLRKDHSNGEPKVWYQGHESIAQRVNDNDYPNRVMRVGKYLFPHGSSAFRICPVCKKTNFVVRGINENYTNYYGPGILPEFNNFYESGLLTDDEIEAFKKGKFDSVQCYECGNITRSIDTPLILQSAIKGKKPPLLEEAVNEMSVLIKKADHLIFNGYSLPPDDTIYRSMILSAIADRDPKKKLLITVVNYDEDLQDKDWYKRDDLNSCENENTKNTVNNFSNLFKPDKCEIRFTFLGFPGIVQDKNSINLLLNYK